MAASTTSKSKRKRRMRWSESNEVILLQLWADKIPELRCMRRTSLIHAEIASKMQERGFDFSGAEVKVKIHNMTNRYREEKKKMGPLGESPSTWTWFDRVQSILGSYKTFNLEALTEESSVANDLVAENVSEEFIGVDVNVPELSPEVDSSCEYLNFASQDVTEDSSCSELKKSKQKLNSFQQELLQEFKESNKTLLRGLEEIKERDKEAIKIQKELLEVEKQRNDIFEKFLKVYSEKEN